MAWHRIVNSSLPGQNDRHFADNIFRCIFINEKFCVLMWIWLKFVPKPPIDSKIGSGNGVMLNRRQTITWSNTTPVHWCIYSAPGGDELLKYCMWKMAAYVSFYFHLISVWYPLLRTHQYRNGLHMCVPMRAVTQLLPLVPHICVSESGQHWFR